MDKMYTEQETAISRVMPTSIASPRPAFQPGSGHLGLPRKFRKEPGRVSTPPLFAGRVNG